MRLRWVLALLGVLCLAAAGVQAADPPRPFRFPEGKSGKGTLRYINRLPVLTVSGTPEDIGTAVGVLAVAPGQKMLDYPEDVLRQYHLHFLWGPLLAAGKHMAQRFPEDFSREMEAMAKSSRVDHDHIIAGNTLFDIKKVLACSASSIEPGHSATGAPIVGRNLDYPSLGYAEEFSLVTVCRPDAAKHAFVSVGFPGLVGCLSGMNDAGLTVSVLEVFQAKVGVKRFDSTGTPYALCYRRLLEECATVKEAAALLATMHRSTMTNLVLADRKSVAVAEVTPTRVVIRDPVCGGLRLYESLLHGRIAAGGAVELLPQQRALQGAWTAWRGSGPVALADVRDGLHAARNDADTLQSMIFEPASLRLHLAIGRCPASAGEMRVLDLAPLFRPALSQARGRKCLPSHRGGEGSGGRCLGPLTSTPLTHDRSPRSTGAGRH